MIARLTRNIKRLPARLARTVEHQLDPVYRLQREANRRIPALFGQDVIHNLETIPGNCSSSKCRLLAHLAMRTPPTGDWVEIGTFKGRTAAWLVEAADRCPLVPTVVTIDPHERGTWQAFQETTARFDLVERGLDARRATSRAVGAGWNRPISFLWIDGSHHYDDVRADIEHFVPWVLPGGLIVFDDAAGGIFPEVEQALADHMDLRLDVESIGKIRAFAIYRKRPWLETARRRDAEGIDWNEETLRYHRPHARLLEVAKLLAGFQERRLLDVGCSTGALRTLLPSDFIYHGCDVSDHVRSSLPAGRFQQIDFNQSTDLSMFKDSGIDCVHIGGVLEYLNHPEGLLMSLRSLVAPGRPLVATIINFGADRYQDPAKLNPAWVFRPSVAELTQVFGQCGWRVEKIVPFLEGSTLRRRVRSRLAKRIGPHSPWTKRRSTQFLFIVKAD